MSLKPHTTGQLESAREDPVGHELEYVHRVYDYIADHFSATRYKPWPIISQFLSTIPSGSLGLDSGTGNGKYLPLDQNGGINMIGLDRSRNLLEHAQTSGGQKRDVILGDALRCSYREGTFDFAISIATIHHFSTPERRCLAVQSLLRSISPHCGRLLIYVWALQQDDLSKRLVPADPVDGSRLAQDVFVPWTKSVSGDTAIAVRQRYYHLFDAGELRQTVLAAASSLHLGVLDRRDHNLQNSELERGIEIVQEGWERSNWYLELQMWCRGTRQSTNT